MFSTSDQTVISAVFLGYIKKSLFFFFFLKKEIIPEVHILVTVLLAKGKGLNVLDTFKKVQCVTAAKYTCDFSFIQTD